MARADIETLVGTRMSQSGGKPICGDGEEGVVAERQMTCGGTFADKPSSIWAVEVEE
jgi:hypothetical protein